MVNIDGDDIAYAVIEGMYEGNRDGYGLQVNDENRRDAIKRMCDKIADAVKEYECS